MLGAVREETLSLQMIMEKKLPECSDHDIQYLTVLVATIDAQWEGMGYVGSARYEPALLPPCPSIRVF